MDEKLNGLRRDLNEIELDLVDYKREEVWKNKVEILEKLEETITAISDEVSTIHATLLSNDEFDVKAINEAQSIQNDIAAVRRVIIEYINKTEKFE